MTATGNSANADKPRDACNGVADRLKHAHPHVSYRAEFCHSTLNIGAPQNGERCGSGPLGSGVADP